MKIGIDIDDVLIPFMQEFLNFHEKENGEKVDIEKILSYNSWAYLSLSKEEVYTLFELFFNSGDFSEISLKENSKESILRLSLSHEIFFITSRPSVLNSLTQEFLDKHFSEMSYLLIHADSFHESKKEKHEICNFLGIDIMIEDRKKYACECANNGIRVFLFDKPWNRKIEDETNMLRVKNWKEVMENFNEHAGIL